MNPSQRKKLESLAHALKPAVNIGKEGLTDGVISFISENIEKNELIKIKFLQNKRLKENISNEIISFLKCEIVSIIGNTLIIYKQSENPKNRHIKI